MASCWLALRAVRRVSPRDAFLAGLLAMLAVGMKQSIVGGLVFGAVLLAGSLVARQVGLRDALRCAGAAAAGAAVPVAVVVAWAVGAGVRLQTLWFAVVTFRSDASHVIATQESEGATSRISVLLLIFVGTGMLLVVALFAVRLRSLLRHDPVPVVAIAVMLGLDLLGVALSGSFWAPYLFVPLPGVALALAALVAHDHLDRVRHRVTPVAVGLVVVSSVVALVGWTGAWVGGRVPVEVRTGEAIAAAAWPGDRVLVYGGRADIQWATGAQSPYPYLWSLPMRTLDPGLDDLEEVLTGSNPPTWFVEATFITTWSELGTTAIQSSLIRKYAFVQTACGRYRIYHLNTVDPVEVDVDCSTPFRTIWGR
jgi:4-amino-4-deoxy-L-arabinose transferase-like glycosyltransferase